MEGVAHVLCQVFTSLDCTGFISGAQYIDQRWCLSGSVRTMIDSVARIAVDAFAIAI